jgi:hypothetical protein
MSQDFIQKNPRNMGLFGIFKFLPPTHKVKPMKITKFFYYNEDNIICTVKRGYSGQNSAFSLNLSNIKVRIDLKVTSTY